ncbi:predicted protein [Sclerotinia sclerotiorum 1980 UF-70]|uniref:Uncharacterized protein n=1 Tax=Sclerotinia sclerotiorum (strain ATCC 18683 / 1980 / Ss-1) TaxID=665079 RepID=A7E9G2_SCLS1|nr:predicted protein [Sclerotinia sclerotiorum 1980 UF-70]EDN97014.1 predicted protein [Sclerotinia sclerotiorum 1980 UF-70]
MSENREDGVYSPLRRGRWRVAGGREDLPD